MINLFSENCGVVFWLVLLLYSVESSSRRLSSAAALQSTTHSTRSRANPSNLTAAPPAEEMQMRAR